MNVSSWMVGCLAIVCSLCILVGCGDGGDSSSSDNKTTVIPPEITFTVSEKNLTIGDEEYLFPVYEKTQGYTLQYQSSNPAIVQVDSEGKISAQAEGSATVSAIYSNGTTKVQADVLVKSSFGGYLPELKTSGIDETLAITLNDTYTLSPYVVFNGKTFDDVTVSYDIVNDSVAQVNEKGEVVAKSKGKTELVLQGNWRGKDKTGAPTMQKTVSLSVIDDVRFYNNGEAISDQALYTLSEFEGESYQNTLPCNFKVMVNGAEESANVVIENENVLIHQGDYLLASGFGETKVRVEKQVDSETYVKEFTVFVQRIEKTVESRVPLFSTVDGTYLEFAKNQKQGVLSFIGETNSVVDAYQGNRQLTVENGKILGVESSSQTSRGIAEISVGTNSVIYHFQLETLAKTLSVKEDLYALQQVTGQTLEGYYELLCDLDATGITLNQKVLNLNDPVTCFSGVFNGAGHTVSNLVLVEEASMFGSFSATATVKNLALVNLTATRAHFLAEQTYNDGVTISNVYISLNSETVSPRGLTGRTASNSVCKNVVIEYLGENAEKNREYESSQYLWQGLIGGVWRRVIDGKIYAQDSKWKDVYVISPFVVSFRANEKNDLSGEQQTAVYVYGANETKDIYGNLLEESVHTRPDPNLGANWWKESYVSAKYTNLYHYTDYAALENANVDYTTFDSAYWVVYNNRVVWKSLFEKSVSLKVYQGSQEYDTRDALATVGKRLQVKAFVNGQEIAGSAISVSIAENEYLTWDSNANAIKVSSLPQTGREKIQITVTIKLSQGEITQTFTLTVRGLQVPPIHSGGNFDSGENYDGYYGGEKEPIQSGGDFDGGDNYDYDIID